MSLCLDSMSFRLAKLTDLAQLIDIEQQCFQSDKLSKRSFKYHLQAKHSIVLVAYQQQSGTELLLGYGLCLLNKGTRLARLYSLAVLPSARGCHLGAKLLTQLETLAKEHGRIFMRLEVACNNHRAIALYQTAGYKKFGLYHDYYDDHGDAIRMQKTIRHYQGSPQGKFYPWYQQSTEFTCGPAALMMAMASCTDAISCDRSLEISLWREATTVFMTSGVGGTHPFGLALAANKRGFNVEVLLNTQAPLFIDGVRSAEKKSVMTLVHDTFTQQCQEKHIAIHYQNVEQQQIENWLADNAQVLMLISTYRLDGKKAPHWVLITGVDERCFYVHDPDMDEQWQSPIDCQYVPIAREDFDKMSAFGSHRLRVALKLQYMTSSK